MKNILVVLLLFVVHISFAQKFYGLFETRKGTGIFEFTPSLNTLDTSKLMNNIVGTPDLYAQSMCHFDGHIYGRTLNTWDYKYATIYEYNLANKEYEVLYTSQWSLNSYTKILVSKTGVLYGIDYDTINGAFVLELNRETKNYKKYYADKNTNLIDAHHFVIAENNKMYFITKASSTSGESINKLVEFDLETKMFADKLVSTDLLDTKYGFNEMNNIGDGKLAATGKVLGSQLRAFVYDYVSNTITTYKNENLINNYMTDRCSVVSDGNYLYMMTSSLKNKDYGYLLRIDMKTGQYDEVSSFNKIKAYCPIACFISNDMIYGYDLLGNKIIGYDLKSGHCKLVRLLIESDGINANSGFILVK